ncbi:MAG: helix-turn-helix domain-containing protein [Anaeroplasmataceae bacterium]|nr:helix-turn-helix domain-containing protein [Anaeroplasmataceae bacterium]
MEKYILLKTAKENYPYILDVFQMLLGNMIQVEQNNDWIKIKSEWAEEGEIEATIESLEGDLNALISSYQTTTSRPVKEIAIVENIFLEVPYGHYQFKTIALQVKNKTSALEIFNFIVEGSGVTEDIILAMADCDLNVSKASALLYMHRNTLIYKIERLMELKNFDLKSFNDLYLLVQLLRA